ncbi:HAD-superfamily hydrolase, subfamily IIA [Staphylothermus marinus F1]|uniref:HAD-superfamily hydrolase, subfamily IIA n=1 Tax=Staphylothermus marinus (strain ATCC 43588 / DSM 3639 / JCM 9404 / F1) TaxID=399550 RepID=A3DP43_STAMF|nr:HAD-IIA family hydrolase [Staphylothermus marinus]ABN70403.1 HAD-superfamily hydrolase, subfamily IIA [Staphylothermus marinus F1]
MYKGVIIDLDGVVWRGEKPLKNNIEAIKKLEKSGLKIIYLSNNATRSRIEYVYKIRRYGLKASEKNVINSAFAAAQYIVENGGSNIFIIGEAGLYYECTKAGLLPVTIGTPAQHVLVGLDRFVTYNKLLYATELIRNGAKFIAANTDKTFPVENRLDPGAGSIVAFLEASTGKKPDAIIGKPNPWILDLALRMNGLSRKDVLIVGDRLDTDILLGINCGADTLLVLTGVNSIEDIEKTGINPKYVAKDLLSFINDYPELFGL